MRHKLSINKFGFELEGQFFKDPRILSTSLVKVTGDGSINRNYSASDDTFCYEIISNPFKYEEFNLYANELAKLNNSENKIAIVNTSCGTHIHISFSDDIDYKLVNSYRVYKEFMKAYKQTFKLPKYEERLHNNYCNQYTSIKQYSTLTPEQIKATEKTGCRYQIFNYCKHLHNTLEIRIFPYVTTIKGLQDTLDFVYKFFSELNFTEEEYIKVKKIFSAKKLTVYTRNRNANYYFLKEILGDSLRLNASNEFSFSIYIDDSIPLDLITLVDSLVKYKLSNEEVDN